jgi:regulator of replication initiation timing
MSSISELEQTINDAEVQARQLAANIHEMRMSIQRGVARENGPLRDEIRRLRDENSRLRDENDTLRSTHRTVNRLTSSR